MDLINQLKKNGYRVTTSREIICKILEESGHEHFTADNLFKLARKYSKEIDLATIYSCLLYTSPSPRDRTRSRMPSSA